MSDFFAFKHGEAVPCTKHLGGAVGARTRVNTCGWVGVSYVKWLGAGVRRVKKRKKSKFKR